MADELAFFGDLVVVKCWCGIRHGVPSELRRHQLAEHDRGRQFSVWCPLGHTYVPAGPSAEDKLRQAHARERHLQDQLQAAEAEAEAIRVRLVRDRHRFANGVCPCCNRSFENVARHMKTKHPDYDPADLAAHEPMFKCSCDRRFQTLHGLRIHQAKSRGDDWADPSTWAWRRHLTVADR